MSRWTAERSQVPAFSVADAGLAGAKKTAASKATIPSATISGMAPAMEIRLERVKLTSVLNCGTPVKAGHSVRLGLKTDCAIRDQSQIRYALCPYMLTLTG